MDAQTPSGPTSNQPVTPPVPHVRLASATLTAPAPDAEHGGFRWTTGLIDGAGAGRAPRPWITRPEPRLRQLMGVCGWAAVLGGIGLIIGIRGFIGVLGNDAPGWYEPSIVAAGLAGIALTVGAFLTVHRQKQPWVMLTMSSLALITSMVLTSMAL